MKWMTACATRPSPCTWNTAAHGTVDVTCETKSTLVPVLAIVSCAVTADVVNVAARSSLGPIEICAVAEERTLLYRRAYRSSHNSPFK